MVISDNAVIVDTNVMSYALKGWPIAQDYRRLLIGYKAHISFVTAAELDYWAKKDRWGAPRYLRMQHFLDSFPVVPFSTGMEKVFGDVMAERQRMGRRIEHADAWIAATALYLGVPLVTNDAGFVYTRGLRVITASAAVRAAPTQLPVVMRPDLSLDMRCRCSL